MRTNVNCIKIIIKTHLVAIWTSLKLSKINKPYTEVTVYRIAMQWIRLAIPIVTGLLKPFVCSLYLED